MIDQGKAERIPPGLSSPGGQPPVRRQAGWQALLQPGVPATAVSLEGSLSPPGRKRIEPCCPEV